MLRVASPRSSSSTDLILPTAYLARFPFVPRSSSPRPSCSSSVNLPTRCVHCSCSIPLAVFLLFLTTSPLRSFAVTSDGLPLR
jgi:hypothetical protein